MHVTEQYHLVLLVIDRDQLLRVVDSGVQNLGWIRPSSVQVRPRHVTPVVSNGDSIGIQHGNNLEYEGVSEQLGLPVGLLQEEFNGPMDHEGGITFARMHP